ncbi:hypothetical protein [Pleionea litopenaei]|uniref:Aspartyl protease n=1 Tax=Pleionea litopenaei TaxID=3070815 RepID=A0AA51X890_9GAMM|nr:hypothetical protein [Pleionea sp. HL-JVS1]WMS87865.1 hypothetical protein Q9312_02810 [Pleionea sp. HL-JVS1]
MIGNWLKNISLSLVLFNFGNLYSESLPSAFHNNLIHLKPVLVDGHQLTLFTDTGGGWNAISTELVTKYQWKVALKQADEGKLELVEMPSFREGKAIPKGDFNNFFEGKLLKLDQEKFDTFNADIDGFLGARWHAGKIIDFNYRDQSISIYTQLPPEINSSSIVHLGFQKNEEGSYTTAFPRVTIEVAGKKLEMLFDTGATALLSKEAQKILKFDDARVATSFIAGSIFDGWTKEHPDWTVIANACSYSRASMIKVPVIVIGGKNIGPVWFTRRPDNSFYQYMSKYMDKPIDGALGGSALQYIRIVVDYPRELAYLIE